MKSKINPKENTVAQITSGPYEDPKQARTRNTPDWIVVERNGDFIRHHRFESLEAAEAFVASRS